MCKYIKYIFAVAILSAALELRIENGEALAEGN